MKKGELPSAKADRVKNEAKAREDQISDQEKILRGAMARTFKTRDGKVVLHWLMKECGYNSPIAGADSRGDLDEKRTMYGALRLNLYLKLRKFLPVTILQEVEYHEHS